jgi:hypothetical protein
MSLLDPLEVIQTLIPGSRVAIMRLEDDPSVPSWCAWIEWRRKGPHSLTVGGWTKRDALVALREAVQEYLAKPRKPAEDDPNERAAIQGEPMRKDVKA